MAKLGFWILVCSELLSVSASLWMFAFPSGLPEPWLRSGDGEILIRAWGVTWLALSAVRLTILFTTFWAERWAWLVMLTVPLVWLAHSVLAPGTVHNVILAIVTSLALAMTLAPSRSRESR